MTQEFTGAEPAVSKSTQTKEGPDGLRHRRGLLNCERGATLNRVDCVRAAAALQNKWTPDSAEAAAIERLERSMWDSRVLPSKADVRILLDALAKQDGWIKWSGGQCPVSPETIVEVRHRAGEVSPGALASVWIGQPGLTDAWKHENDQSSHIIAYRVVERGQ